MTAETAFFLILVLACPLMMLFMMRGHGGGTTAHGGAHGRHQHVSEPQAESTKELRRLRDELDRLIDERERADADRELEPAGPGRR